MARPQGAPDRAVMYVHGADVPGRNQTFAIHSGQTVIHRVIPADAQPAQLGDTVVTALSDNNARMSCLVINAHGAGAGTVTLAGTRFRLEQRKTSFEKMKPYFTAGAEIRIYACLFASETYFADSEMAEAWIPFEQDEHRNRGHGTEAMKKIAQVTGCTVLAGFDLQHGTSGRFIGPYVRCSPAGEIKVLQGRGKSLRLKVGDLDALTSHYVSEGLSKIGL